MCSVFRALGLGPISNSKTSSAADLSVTCEHNARAPVAAGTDKPHAMPAEVQGRGGKPNPSGHIEAVPGRQSQLERTALAGSFEIHFRRVVCNVQAPERFR